MPPPPQPAPPFLFGASQQAREDSRTATTLRLDWSPVPTALEYDVRFGSADIRFPALPGQIFAGLSSNTRQAVRLRARNLDGDSPWSDLFDLAFTRPLSPGAPTLASDAERKPDSLGINWSSVPGVPDYDLRANGVELVSVGVPPFILSAVSGSPLEPNVRYTVSIRSRDNLNGGTSDWSGNCRFVTRPPTPDRPQRKPYDMFGYGTKITWHLTEAYDGGTQSFAVLTRQLDANKVVLANGQNEPDGLRVGRLNDMRFSYAARREYRVMAIVPPGSVPANDVIAGENISFESESLVASIPWLLSTSHAQAADHSDAWRYYARSRSLRR